MYFALASLRAYLFDVLVLSIIGAIVLIICLSLIKRTQLFLSLFGGLLILSSVPIAIMSELSITGCCGAPSSGHKGMGLLIGLVVLLAGVGILLFGKKLAKRQSIK